MSRKVDKAPRGKLRVRLAVATLSAIENRPLPEVLGIRNSLYVIGRCHVAISLFSAIACPRCKVSDTMPYCAMHARQVASA